RRAIEHGRARPADQHLSLGHGQLRKLALARRAAERARQTLSSTWPVHEAYIRLVDDNAALKWDSRGHFFAAAAEAMRGILVEAARAKASAKRGGQFERIELSEVARTEAGDRFDLLALDEALGALEQSHPEKAQIVKLRF